MYALWSSVEESWYINAVNKISREKKIIAGHKCFLQLKPLDFGSRIFPILDTVWQDATELKLDD